MWKMFVLVLGLTASGVAAFAQNEIDAQANVILPDGRRELVISNHSTKTIVAWACQYTYRVGSDSERVWDGFQDVAIDGSHKPVGPGAQETLPAGPLARGRQVSVWNVEFRAALFDDGTTFGDPAWVTRIQHRRLIAIEALDAQLGVLIAATPKVSGGAITREALVEQLRGEMAGRRDRLSDPDDKLLIFQMHAVVSGNLAAHADRPLPEAVDMTRAAIGRARARMMSGTGGRGNSRLR